MSSKSSDRSKSSPAFSRNESGDGDGDESESRNGDENENESEDEDGDGDGDENGNGDESDSHSLSKDEIFGTLSNARRRRLLSWLNESPDGEAKIRDLSREIAGLENGVAPEEVTYVQRKRVYTSLYQSHVPQLARRGIVEYDAPSGTVRLTEAAKTFDVYLEVVEEKELTWAEFYVLLSVLAGLVVLGVLTDAAFFSRLPAIAAAALVAIGFGAASLVQLYQTRRNRL
ncbi:MAG: hypothetical protein V5A46_05180 [Haloferacaceae archaeon]